MSEHEAEPLTSISKAGTPEAVGEYWDAHSLADHWEQTTDAEFEVRAPHRWRVALDPEMYAQLLERAHTRGIALETLVNLWLAEHLQKAN